MGAAASGKSSPQEGAKNPESSLQRVLVEMRVDRARGPQFAFELVSQFSLPAFVLDRNYSPVPVSAHPGQAPELAMADQQVVIVRGTIDPAKIEQLKAQPNVIAVHPDIQISPFGVAMRTARKPGLGDLVPAESFGTCPIPPCDCDPSTPKGTIADVASFLGVDQIWAAGFHGEGMVIGLVDGGITALGRTPKPGETARIPRVVDGWPTADWGTTSSAWGDHANMTATDALGMAPQAQLYDIRISDGANAPSWLSNALSGFQWAIDSHKATGKPQVLSNSWGIYQQSWGPDYATNPNHFFTRKVVDAISEGILVLFAAGNCGQACPSSQCGSDIGPARSIWGANGHPLVMTVGAANKDQQLAGYSSQGPAALDPQKPDFCSITHFQGYTFSDNGTSAATPIAAGLVALLKQANSTLTQAQVKDALKATARDIGPAGWDQHSGAGILQARAAFDLIARRGVWSGWLSRGGLLNSAPLAIAWGPNRVDVFARGSDNTAWHRAYNGSGWADWESLGGLLPAPPTAVTWGPNRLDVFAVGRDSALWHRAGDGAVWQDWESLGGAYSSPPAAVTWGPNRLDVFIKAQDSSIWHRAYDGSAWAPWETLGGAMSSPPVAVSWGPGRLDVFAQGSDNAAWHRAYNGSSWADWESLGGLLPAPPTAVTWGPNRLDVFAVGRDSALWHRAGDGSTWEAWESLGGMYSSQPGAVTWGPNRLDVFIKADDSSIWHRASDGSAWLAWESLGGAMSAPPAGVTWGPNRLYLFALGIDNALWRQAWG